MTLGFIGSGKMAGALVKGVTQAGALAPSDIFITDAIPAAAAALSRETGVQSLATNAEIAARVDALVMCVKPGDAAAAFEAMRGATAGKLVISIMAGITLEKLASLADIGARLVRVMPNTPALIHQGAAAFACGEGVTEADEEIVTKLFRAVGTAARVKETLLDAVTGLSGSGPAYGYVIIEALADAGVLMGLPRELALELSAQTVAGAAAMVLQTGEHPARLKDMVASPGGTTIAGLEALEKHGLRFALQAAVRAATERSRELGQQS